MGPHQRSNICTHDAANKGSKSSTGGYHAASSEGKQNKQAKLKASKIKSRLGLSCRDPKGHSAMGILKSIQLWGCLKALSCGDTQSTQLLNAQTWLFFALACV
eukprot:1152605-Pelagomonas_calceolata.AAC.3